ncbi:MAG TPA: heme-degrading domain-containing protein [Dactylosporangium sp.]|nr:heme-degrading domain-containing protein [Dactylosporangium sp.]
MQELIAELEAQEQRLVLDRFDNDDAWALGCLLVEVARERGVSITVDVRRGGQQLFHAALPGTAPDNDRWIERKIRVVERLHASSYLVGRRLAAKGATFDAGYGVDPADYATHGGAFPIRVRNVGVVGVVTVSGLPQADDHALVVEVLGRFLEGVS